MKKSTLVLLVIGLSGCVNPYKYRENQTPQQTFTSSKAPVELQECILESWQQNPMAYGVSAQKTGRYYSVIATADNADIYSDGNIARVDYYSLRGALDPWRGKQKRIESIRNCL